MKIRSLGANRTELHLPSGAVVLFSYETPVAAQRAQGGFIRTSKRWSVTTSKHISQWLQGARAIEVDQSELDQMVQS